MSCTNQLIYDISNYVNRLFAKKINDVLCFHNLAHTQMVVSAVEEIGLESGLTGEQINITKIAAWFHDTGYVTVYKGHETLSAEIAADYLTARRMSESLMSDVRDCILATRMPQQPTKMTEKVICDADFYHLSLPDYSRFEWSLRHEWEVCLDLRYTNQQWNSLNLNMLNNHEYFTYYGRTVLQQRKRENIQRFRQLLTTCDL